MARKGGGVSAVAALRQRQRQRASKQEGQATCSVRTKHSQAAKILFPRFLDLPMELRINIYPEIDRISRHKSDY